MAHTTQLNTEYLAQEFRRVAQDLSPSVLDFLRDHPEALSGALSVFVGTVSTMAAVCRRGDLVRTYSGAAGQVDGVEPTLLSQEEAERRLAQRVRSRTVSTGSLLTTEQVREHTTLKTRKSVHDWRRTGRIIGWQGAKRGYAFPAEQFDDRGQPLEGLQCVCDHFPDGYSAWIWMTTPLESLDGDTPLDQLRDGQISRVARAAQGNAQGDFS